MDRKSVNTKRTKVLRPFFVAIHLDLCYTDFVNGEALKALIAEREATNRALLNFYQGMAVELKPKPNSQQTILEGIERMLCNPEIPEGLKQTLAAELMTAL